MKIEHDKEDIEGSVGIMTAQKDALGDLTVNISISTETKKKEKVMIQYLKSARSFLKSLSVTTAISKHSKS